MFEDVEEGGPVDQSPAVPAVGPSDASSPAGHVRAVADEPATPPSAARGDRVAELTEEVAGLRRALETRAVIEQAKGIIMGATGCDADHAFELLVRQSQHENRKVAAVAEALVSNRTGRAPQP